MFITAGDVNFFVAEAEMSYFNLDVIQVEQKVAALSQRIDALINQQSKLS